MTDVEMAPPVGQPIDLAEPWSPPVSEPVEMLNYAVQAAAQPTSAEVAAGFALWAQTWLNTIAPEVEAKAKEYGSNSLARKGHRFASAQNRNVSHSDALQLGALQYVLEKLDRAEDALLRGQTPSDDTLADGVVYLLMTMYIRTFGRWV